MAFIYKPSSKFDAPFNKERCVANVPYGGRSVSFHQCLRKGKYEDNEGHLWCKQHHPDTVKEKRDRLEAEWKTERERKENQWRRRNAERVACEGVLTEVLENIKVKDLLEQPENPRGG